MGGGVNLNYCIDNVSEYLVLCVSSICKYDKSRPEAVIDRFRFLIEIPRWYWIDYSTWNPNWYWIDKSDKIQNPPRMFGIYLVILLIWASYQIRNTAGCACAGNAGNVFPRRRLQRKPLVSDPDMHHGTCVTYVSWCLSGALAFGGGENVPGIPGPYAPAIFRIWQ